MFETRQFIVLITGVREQAPLGPNVVDIDEMVSVLQHAKDLLFPEPKDRPRVSVKIEEGSVKIILVTAAAAVIQTQALLAEVNRSKNLDILSPRQAAAILQFQKFSRDNHFNLYFGEKDRLDEGLTITPATEWKQAKPVWVDAEHTLTQDEQEESAEAYLNRLVKEASPNWEKVKDPEAWLREIRGYGN